MHKVKEIINQYRLTLIETRPSPDCAAVESKHHYEPSV